MALDAASLIEYLQSSPLGSVGLPHVQQKDFVLVNHKSLKLTDLDEADLEEKTCSESSDCFLQSMDVGKESCKGLCTELWSLFLIGWPVSSPNLLRTVWQTIICFVIERRRTFSWPNIVALFLNGLMTRCKLRHKLAAKVQQTAWSKM